jgi:hypothetical protein
MGTYTQTSEESNSLRRDSADNLSPRNADVTAEAVGRDNGRTTIGTASGDTGKSGLDAAARGLAAMGVDDFQIVGGGKAEATDKEKLIERAIREYRAETACERAVRNQAEMEKLIRGGSGSAAPSDAKGSRLLNLGGPGTPMECMLL